MKGLCGDFGDNRILKFVKFLKKVIISVIYLHRVFNLLS